MCVYMCGSRYSSLKYKQYYTIKFLVCVSILFIVPEFWVSVRGITQKIIILHGAWILCVGTRTIWVAGLPTFGVFPNENDYRLHSYLRLTRKCE